MPDGVISPDGRSSTYDYRASGKGPTATDLVDRALARMSDQLDPYDAARQLLTRWIEGDSSLSHLLPHVMDDLAAREKAQPKPDVSKTKRATKGPRVGDFAFIASGLGPTFLVIRKIHVDSAGKLTAVTLGDPNSTGTGQATPINRVTAIFSNILNTQE